MQENLARLLEVAKRPRTFMSVVRLEEHLKRLSAGDRFIAALLGAFLIVSALSGLYALERSLLVEVPAQGGTLQEGVVGSPRFVSPLLALSDADRDLVALTYSGLMGIGMDGTLTPVLAERYEIAEDGKTYTFVLRENLTFSDGTPLSAEDVVFTVEKAQDPALKSPERANWDGIGVEALDPRTVRFTLSKSYAPFLENTTLGILPARLWRNVSDEEFPFSTLQTEPAGAGPFTVSYVSRNTSGIIEEYVLSAFDSYALGRPYLDEMRFRFFSQESDLAKALGTGAVESAYGIPDARALSAPSSRGVGVFWYSDENPVFARPEVRKALSVAIDRNGIVRDVLGGFATAIKGPMPPGGHTALESETAEERIRSAKETLEKSGWTYDTETRAWKQSKDKLVLSITLKTSNVPELKAVATKIRDDWQLLGVPVSIELYEPGDLNQNVIRPRAYSALLFGMVVGRDRDLFAFWHSSQRNDPGLNIALYANRSIDALIEKARGENDAIARERDLAEIEEAIAADYPAAFTHAPDFLYTMPENVRGVSLPQITAPADRFASVASWYRRTEPVWPFFVKD